MIKNSSIYNLLMKLILGLFIMTNATPIISKIITTKEDRIQFFVKLDLQADKLAEFLPKYKHNTIQTRLEQGSVAFEMYTNDASKGKFVELIKWKNKESIDIHFAKEYFKDLTEFREKIENTPIFFMETIELSYVAKELITTDKEYKSIFLMLSSKDANKTLADFNTLLSSLMLNKDIVEASLHQATQNSTDFVISIKFRPNTKDSIMKEVLNNNFFITYKPTDVNFAKMIVKFI
jgi:quinol monooxygenase YgiN